MPVIISRRTWPLLLAALSIFACEDDPVRNPNDGDPGDAYPATTTPEQVVTNLLKTYDERNYEEYEALLHPDFLFYLSQGDVANGADQRFDRARDLEATYGLFSGEPGQTPDGALQPPIRSIDLRLTPVDSGWTDEVAEDFTGTMVRRYEVDMIIEYAAGKPSCVVGRQEFYVAPVTNDEGTVYQLKFWRDLGKDGLKATVCATWGSIKSW
jgi:hypothetical protein